MLVSSSALFWFILAFIAGALPFSVWLARLRGKDPRLVGDGNPGATNAFKAGGTWIGLAALLLDVSKAALPVGLAYQVFDLGGWSIVPIALAPTLGHAFSPFLNFKGGKALATVLGVWIGLTLWDMPLVIVVGITAWYLLLKNSAWAVLFTLLVMAIYLLVFRPEPLFYWILGLQAMLVLWKHRQDFQKTAR
jgi:glycerol-3-phosphate acyltransferase PlsY